VGIDLNGAQLLIRAQRSGVSFERMATLGHQAIHCHRPSLVSVLRKAGYDLPRETVRKLLDPTTVYSDDFFRVLGAREQVVIDANDYEGAHVVHDMNRPIPASLFSSFDLVLDGGTLEHVFDFLTALRNAAAMVRPQGRFLSITMANNFCGHGFYQFSPELFYRFFSPENGYGVESCIVWDGTWRSRFYQVSDPDTVRSRVEFRTEHGDGVYMFVQAKRIGALSREFIPQQSDYVRLWEQDGETSGKPGGLKAAIRRNPTLWSVAKSTRRLLDLQLRRFSAFGFRRGGLRGLPKGALTPLRDVRVLY
jgi:SAM-dependent methyltransferase